MKILITGITGFLGTQLARDCISKGIEVCGTSHSEVRHREFKEKFPDIEVFSIDLYSDLELLKRAIKSTSSDYVIHAAAMKHFGICEDNKIRCIQTNVIGSLNVINAATSCNVKNVFAVSTDKAISPSGVYGASKYMADLAMFEAGFAVIRGVNFFFSTGSVLDIWNQAMAANEPIRVNSRETIRYFVDVADVSKTILDNLDSRGEVYLPKCLEVKLSDLADAFCDYHNYHNRATYTPWGNEKGIAALPLGIKVERADFAFLVNYFKAYYR